MCTWAEDQVRASGSQFSMLSRVRIPNVFCNENIFIMEENVDMSTLCSEQDVAMFDALLQNRNW